MVETMWKIDEHAEEFGGVSAALPETIRALEESYNSKQSHHWRLNHFVTGYGEETKIHGLHDEWQSPVGIEEHYE